MFERFHLTDVLSEHRARNTQGWKHVQLMDKVPLAVDILLQLTACEHYNYSKQLASERTTFKKCSTLSWDIGFRENMRLLYTKNLLNLIEER